LKKLEKMAYDKNALLGLAHSAQGAQSQPFSASFGGNQSARGFGMNNANNWKSAPGPAGLGLNSAGNQSGRGLGLSQTNSGASSLTSPAGNTPARVNLAASPRASRLGLAASPRAQVVASPRGQKRLVPSASVPVLGQAAISPRASGGGSPGQKGTLLAPLKADLARVWTRVNGTVDHMEKTLLAKQAQVKSALAQLEARKKDLQQDFARKKAELQKREEEVTARETLFKAQVKEFEKNRNEIEEDIYEFKDVVKLNVGGKKYETTLQVLQSVKGSRLGEMFNGSYELKPLKDGSFFIDRDPAQFIHILNFHRDQENAHKSFPKDRTSLAVLKYEATYFKVADQMFK